MISIIICLLVSAIATSPVKVDPVCILGAGPSGLTAARELQKRNIPFVIFEKESQVGGKAINYIDPETGHPYYLGPVLAAKMGYPETMKLANEFNISQVVVPKRTVFNAYEWKTGFLKTVFTSDPPSEVQAGFQKFIQLRQTYEKYLIPGFKNGVPGELAVPFFEWLKTNDLQLLDSYFWIMITVYGYGSLTETPALYILHYLSPKIILALISAPGFDLVTLNYHELFVKLAESLNGRIFLNSTVRRIQRTDNRYYSQKCKALIFAFAPEIGKIINILDITEDEELVLSQVKTISYYSGVSKASLMDKNRYLNFLQLNSTNGINIGPPLPDSQPLGFFHHLLYESDLVTYYSWDKADSFWKVYKTAKETLSKLNRNLEDGVNSAVPLTDKDMKMLTKWDYFPHVSSVDIKFGFYKNFNDMQGYLNTYWTSSLNGFEIVESVIQNAIDLVNTNF